MGVSGPVVHLRAIEKILDRSGGNGVRFPRKIELGGVAERLKAPVLKTGIPATGSWVRIPPPPLKKRFGRAEGFWYASRVFQSAFFSFLVQLQERWPSGRRRRTANALYGQKLYRGFESLPLRRLNYRPRFPPGFFIALLSNPMNCRNRFDTWQFYML